MKYVNILDEILDAKYWHQTGTRVHYTHHIYRNSPMECDDSCGTCDGANCDICKKIVEPAGIECSVPTDELADMLTKLGMPADIASDCAYDDFYKPHKTGWDIHWPTEEELKEKYPEKYEEICAVLAA